jgi:hypothetical protein
MNTKPFYQTSINPDVKDEWMNKEEASWEDAGRPDKDHVHPLLASMPKNKIVCANDWEATLIAKSAVYNSQWDSDNKLTMRMEAKCKKIADEIGKIWYDISFKS